MARQQAIDDYIKKAAPFAQPILSHLRQLVHETCPDTEEKMKWSFPHFDYKGEMMCSMAAFKQHCVFGFWKASLMKDPVLVQNAESEAAMGHLGRIRSLEDLPTDKKIRAWIREAMDLNDRGVKLPPRPKTVAKEMAVPEYLTAALAKNKKAFQAFEAYSPSHKNEYVEWITEAKTEATRNKRMETALEWMAEGKTRNWKYASK